MFIRLDPTPCKISNTLGIVSTGNAQADSNISFDICIKTKDQKHRKCELRSTRMILIHGNNGRKRAPVLKKTKNLSTGRARNRVRGSINHLESSGKHSDITIFQQRMGKRLSALFIFGNQAFS
jgi:hypothetical protein